MREAQAVSRVAAVNRAEAAALDHKGRFAEAFADVADKLEGILLDAPAPRGEGDEPAHWARNRAWKRIAGHDRRRLALELIGDDRLIIRELLDRFRAKLPDCAIYEPYVRTIVQRLVADGELVRDAEVRVPGGKSIRYRYHRNTTLEGPIVDLDRAFHEDNEAGR